MKDPAFLLYSSDFLTGTIFMTNEEVGIYIRLMCAQHQHNGRIKEFDFDRIVLGFENVRIKFKKDSSGYYNERLEIEINKRKRDADASRSNGLKGGRPKGNKPKKNLKEPKGKPKKNLTENVNEDEVIDYFKVNGYTNEAAKKFFKFYSEAKWLDSNGKKVLSWKQKAQGVWFKDENKITQHKSLIDQFKNKEVISHEDFYGTNR